MVNDIFIQLEVTFSQRCAEPSLLRPAWNGLSQIYPPDLARFRAHSPYMPSTLVAMRSGDLGMAVLWIVQSALIRSIARECSRAGSDTLHTAIRHNEIGSLAHSEKPGNPVILRKSPDGINLSGEKSYITGGLQTHFIVITAREPGGEKISKLAFVPASTLPAHALEDLRFPALKTTGHARLTMRDMPIPAHHILPLEDSRLRRTISIWGLIERAYIMEAFTGFCIYCARKLSSMLPHSTSIEEKLLALLNEQSSLAGGMLDSAMSDTGRVEMKSADIAALFAIAEDLRTTATHNDAHITPDDRLRFADLGLFSMMKIR